MRDRREPIEMRGALRAGDHREGAAIDAVRHARARFSARNGIGPLARDRDRHASRIAPGRRFSFVRQ
ncbi:hypothetical protein NX868_14860 [Burkholderia thailandensis]|uniref:hypothetical protein n=1 Tax=Burkholderia thailandensis TaxID=57975 RepID=UPI0012D2EC74|nr:hypothetical protein [Burkholderia thailandensis]MCS6454570.1 hypothetical protein [Burkholderia thailandensis]MCS6465752.1 hypothetical protein [Burkholderia thailandensis]MCS6483548.1 hypothetical protein [Burkholderia thailandensis]MCZ2902047.1 hypothetical protein [Burkholderia thailandensis]